MAGILALRRLHDDSDEIPLHQVQAGRIQRRRVHTVARVYVDRSNPLEGLTRDKIKEFYRFQPETLYQFCEILQDKLRRPMNRSNALPVLYQVLICVHFLSCGSYYQVIGSAEKVSRPSVCRCIHSVALAICELTPRFIRLPRPDEINDIMDAFEKKGRCGHWPGLPGVTGAIDGSLVRIEKPKQRTINFICRKSFAAINCQAIVGPDYCFQQTSVCWPGGVGDARMFRASGVTSIYEDGELFSCSALVRFELAQERVCWFESTACSSLCQPQKEP